MKSNIIRKARYKNKLSVKEVSDYLELPIAVYVYYEIFGVGQMHYDVYMDLINMLHLEKNLV
ncbi:XRE family transcriptional regulator [Amedibacillus sp. YH-ame6]